MARLCDFDDLAEMMAIALGRSRLASAPVSRLAGSLAFFARIGQNLGPRRVSGRGMD